MRILVAYATKSGSTAGIAQAVGEELGRMGLDPEVRPVDQVKDVRSYDAVLLGSAIYLGKWRKEALAFGQRHADALRGRPVWLFDSGPLNPTPDQGKNEPVEEADELVRAIGARARITFGGRLIEEDAGWFTRRLVENDKTGNLMFGDFRNFERIREWAREVGTELRVVQPAEAR